MDKKDDSERLKAVEKMLREQEERSRNIIGFVVIAIIIAIIAFAMWNNNRINGNMPDQGVDCPGGTEYCN